MPVLSFSLKLKTNAGVSSIQVSITELQTSPNLVAQKTTIYVSHDAVCWLGSLTWLPLSLGWWWWWGLCWAQRTVSDVAAVCNITCAHEQFTSKSLGQRLASEPCNSRERVTLYLQTLCPGPLCCAIIL